MRRAPYHGGPGPPWTIEQSVFAAAHTTNNLAAVRVLVFHGYLLRGTGSNVYNASLVAALVRMGHQVDLLCQERHADEFGFVGAVGDWDSGELAVRSLRAEGATVYRPD